jgi:DNA-binding transcriptional regulator LsrR (DeoR family)
MQTPNGAEKHNLLVKVARLYYLQQLTHQEIANTLGFSRIKVTRLLQEAVERKVVEFKIADPYVETLELEAALKERFGLTQVVIAPPATSDEERFDILGRYAAGFLSGVLRDDLTIGIGWGRTLNGMVPYLEDGSHRNLNVVSLTGGLTANSEQPNPYDIATSVAHALGATPRYLLTPAIVDRPEEKEILLHNEVNQSVMGWWQKLDVVLMSIGTISPPPQSLTLFPDPRVQVHKLESLGVTGDLLMTFFDKRGTFVKTDFTKRTIRIDFDLIKKAPLVVGVSGGPDKVQSIAGALRTGVINVLVTDEPTARAVVSGRY